MNPASSTNASAPTAMKHNILDSFIRLCFPPCCIVCGNALAASEECLCMQCLQELPKIRNMFPDAAQEIEKRFWGKLPIEKAASYFHYAKGSNFDKILFEIKYHGRKEAGKVMGRHAAHNLLPDGFFEGIDLVIPVPLHPARLKQRGYNQSEWIARGISEITQIPVNTDAVYRIGNNSTQTKKSAWERLEAVQGIFAVRNEDDLEGKHILLVDDVLTTGATLLSCASEIIKAKGTRISMLTLAAV